MKCIFQFAFAVVLMTSLGCGGIGSDGHIPSPRYETPTMIQIPSQFQASILSVSTSGKMVGLGYDSGGATTPFYWASPTAIPQQLDAPSTGEPTYPSCINDSGTIVGRTGSDSLLSQPIVWATPSSSPTPLTIPVNYSFGSAHWINSAGQIVGMIDEPNSANRISGAIWNSPTDVTILGQSANHPLSIATFISDKGDIFGFDSDAYFSQFQFPSYWTNQIGPSLPMQNAGGTMIAGGISSINQRTGVALSVGLYNPFDLSSQTPGLIWKSANSAPAKVSSGIPYSIGDDGVIVGSDLLGNHATVWQRFDKLPIDLNQMIPKSSGWILQSAQFQLSDGSVIGFGTQTIAGVPTDGWFYAKRIL